MHRWTTKSRKILTGRKLDCSASQPLTQALRQRDAQSMALPISRQQQHSNPPNQTRQPKTSQHKRKAQPSMQSIAQPSRLQQYATATHTSKLRRKVRCVCLGPGSVRVYSCTMSSSCIIMGGWYSCSSSSAYATNSNVRHSTLSQRSYLENLQRVHVSSD